MRLTVGQTYKMRSPLLAGKSLNCLAAFFTIFPAHFFLFKLFRFVLKPWRWLGPAPATRASRFKSDKNTVTVSLLYCTFVLHSIKVSFSLFFRSVMFLVLSANEF